MDTAPASGHIGWIHKLGAIGAILVPLAVLISFFTSSDSGETATELIAYAKDNESELWLLQIIGLATPLLIGLFVTSLWVRLRAASEEYRVLAVIGGTLFIAFVSIGLTLWAAPLLSAGELTNAGAEAYLAYDDAGWILLGLGGISIAAMIIGVSLAALQLGLLPKWAAWVSVAFGVVSLATIAAVGIFAWAIWLMAAGLYLLFGREQVAPTADTSRAADLAKPEAVRRARDYCASAFSGSAGAGTALRSS